MQTNPRILRAEADKFDRQQRFPTERDRQQREHILTAAQSLLARHGSHAISFGAMAAALRMAPATLRRHFIDLDALLGEIIGRHLMDISRRLGEIPFNDPDRCRKQREIYFTFCRGTFGGLTEAHRLYTRDRHVLPQDILSHLENTRDGIGELLAGPNAQAALVLLDTPYIPLANIEVMLAALPQEAETATPTEPTPRPKPPRKHRPLRPLPSNRPRWLCATYPTRPTPPTG